MSNAELAETFLAHYGVKGMRWGVRRDRSPQKVQVATQPGKRVKTSGGKYQTTSPEAVRAAIIKQKAAKSTTDSLSNKQLQEAITRMNLERQFAQLAGEHRSVGQKLASAILGQIGDKEAAALGTMAGTATANPTVGFAVGAAARAVGTKQGGGSKKKKK